MRIATDADDEIEAGWLSTKVGELFCSYHPSRGTVQRSCAVLLCDPFGSDRMTLHLTYRELARRLAAAGFSALRVDYPGTCDSEGGVRGAPQIGRWLEGLDAAADWLRGRSGCSELCVFGALLGGTVASLMAARRNDVRGLALWGAYVSGRAALREFAAFRATSGSNPAGLRPTGWEEGDEEAIGFLITRATAAELRAIDLLKSESPDIEHAAIFKRNRAYDVEKLASYFRQTVSNVFVQPEALMDMADLYKERTQPPSVVLDEMLAWWTSTYGEVEPRSDRDIHVPALKTRVALRTSDGQLVHEEVVRFGKDPAMFGIVTEPAVGAETSRLAAIFLAGGTNYHVGINRNNTEWCRSLAAQGLLTMRFDIRGLGESPPRRPEELAMLYLDETRDDVREAIDFLERRYGPHRVALVGLCAGGFQAFHSALSDRRIRGLIMLNPLRFERADASGNDAYDPVEFRSVASYLEMAFDPESWRRIIAGQVKLRRIAKAVAMRLGDHATASTMQAVARVMGKAPPPSTWLAGALLSLTDRGSNVFIVFNEGDGIVSIFDECIALDRERLMATGRFATEVFSNSDHIFSPLWSQEQVGQLIQDRLLEWSERTSFWTRIAS
jgi:dienelactone hydrolase